MLFFCQSKWGNSTRSGCMTNPTNNPSNVGARVNVNEDFLSFPFLFIFFFCLDFSWSLGASAKKYSGQLIVFRNNNKWNKLKKSLILAFIAFHYLDICLKWNIPVYFKVSFIKWSKNCGTRDLQKNFCVLLFRNTVNRGHPNYVLRRERMS